MSGQAVESPKKCVVHAALDDWVQAQAMSSLCRACLDQVQFELRCIESRWDGAMDALQVGRSGGGSERMGGAEVHPPLPINAAASDAMLLAQRAVWSVVQELVVDHRGVTVPADQSTPSLAGWLATWHVGYIGAHPDGTRTLQWYTEIQQAASAMVRVSGNDHVEVYTDKPCGKPVPCLTEGPPFKTVPCPGLIQVAELPDGRRVVGCSADITHAVPYDTWALAHAARKPRPSRARNTLARKLLGGA